MCYSKYYSFCRHLPPLNLKIIVVSRTKIGFDILELPGSFVGVYCCRVSPEDADRFQSAKREFSSLVKFEWSTTSHWPRSRDKLGYESTPGTPPYRGSSGQLSICAGEPSWNLSLCARERCDGWWGGPDAREVWENRPRTVRDFPTECFPCAGFRFHKKL